MSDSLGITSTVKLQNYYLVLFLLTTIQSRFKPSKFNPPSSLPRTLPFIFSIKLCKIPLRLHVSSPSMIGANRVYQLFMISYSPVNWERRERHWNANFVLSAVPPAQAVRAQVINCGMFAALHSEFPFSSLSKLN